MQTPALATPVAAERFESRSQPLDCVPWEPSTQQNRLQSCALVTALSYFVFQRHESERLAWLGRDPVCEEGGVSLRRYSAGYQEIRRLTSLHDHPQANFNHTLAASAALSTALRSSALRPVQWLDGNLSDLSLRDSAMKLTTFCELTL